MDRRLLDYLPPVLREVMEFQAINAANEQEISLAWDALALVMANQFLDTADEMGVSMWEHELNIYPKGTDTMEIRKARIKGLWNMEVPYTFPWLKSWLSGLCGPDGHEESISGYLINIQLDYTKLPEANNLAAEILKMLLMIRPENMQILMTAFLCSTGALHHGAYTELGNRVEIWPRIVNNLESNGTAAMVGPLEYNTAVEIYPKKLRRS